MARHSWLLPSIGLHAGKGQVRRSLRGVNEFDVIIQSLTGLSALGNILKFGFKCPQEKFTY